MFGAFGTDSFEPIVRGLSSDAKEVLVRAISGLAICSGTIKKIIAKTGYGFITPARGGADTFLHVSDNPGLLHYQVGDAAQCILVWDDCIGKFKGTSITAVSC